MTVEALNSECSVAVCPCGKELDSQRDVLAWHLSSRIAMKFSNLAIPLATLLASSWFARVP